MGGYLNTIGVLEPPKDDQSLPESANVQHEISCLHFRFLISVKACGLVYFGLKKKDQIYDLTLMI